MKRLFIALALCLGFVNGFAQITINSSSTKEERAAAKDVESSINMNKTYIGYSKVYSHFYLECSDGCLIFPSNPYLKSMYIIIGGNKEEALATLNDIKSILETQEDGWQAEVEIGGSTFLLKNEKVLGYMNLWVGEKIEREDLLLKVMVEYERRFWIDKKSVEKAVKWIEKNFTE